MTKKSPTFELLQKIANDNRSLKHELFLLKESLCIQKLESQEPDSVKKSEILSDFEEKDDVVLSQKTSIAELHSDKLKLKQQIDSLMFEIQKNKNKENLLIKKIDDLTFDLESQKKQIYTSFSNNVDELKEKDTRILAQGQEIMSLKNTINEISLSNKSLQNKLSQEKQAYSKLKDQITSINRLFVSKNTEVKTTIDNLQKETDKYKKISEDLKLNNEQLISDINKYSLQVKKYQQKLSDIELQKLKTDENQKLDVVGQQQLSIQVYNQNKEIDILKQTILELTHKLKTRKIDEAKMIDLKDKEFDEKLKQLTQDYSKREIELEYKIEDLKKENQALKSDMELLKRKGQQMLESIKTQFNTLL